MHGKLILIMWQNMSLLLRFTSPFVFVRLSKRQTIPCFYHHTEQRDGMVVLRYFHVQNLLLRLTKHGSWGDALSTEALSQSNSIVFHKTKTSKTIPLSNSFITF